MDQIEVELYIFANDISDDMFAEIISNIISNVFRKILGKTSVPEALEAKGHLVSKSYKMNIYYSRYSVAWTTVDTGAGTIYKLKVTQDVALENPYSNHNSLRYLMVSKHPQFSNKRSLLQFDDLPASCRFVVVVSRRRNEKN